MVKGGGVHPPSTPYWADFSIMRECTESVHCESSTFNLLDPDRRHGLIKAATRLDCSGLRVDVRLSTTAISQQLEMRKDSR
jgi:hypothetical protein